MAPPTTSDQALSQYNQFTSGMQSPDTILQGQEQRLGIPAQQQEVSGLRQAITNTTNLLNNVAPSVYGRTGNSLVTSAQATRQIGNEQAPIQANLSSLGAKESNAAADLNTNLSRAQNLASLKATGQTSQQNALLDLYKTLLGREQQNQATALEQQKLAETTRSNKAGEAISASKTGSAEPALTDIAAARSDLVKLSGGDGFVSPQTYARAALSWAAAGYSLADFNKNFSKFKNPDNPNYTI